MSTTASIFSKPKAAYTVLGGPKVDRIRKRQAPLSLLLLNRGSRFYRKEKLGEMREAGVGELLCVEGPRVPYDVEPLSREFPDIRFLLLQEDTSAGEMVNLGIEEARSRLVFVLWSDMELTVKGRQRLAAEAASEPNREILCVVPQLGAGSGEVIPSLQVPALIKGKLKVMPWKPVREGMKSLFPFDYCGLYHRGRFLLSGGYAAWMRNPYWQKLDFGLRCFLWGEQIVCRRDLEARYTGEPSFDDTSADESYKLFFLRNMAVRFNGEMGVLPDRKRFSYILRSDTGWLEGRSEFREVQKWVQRNRYRFKSDVQSLVSHWEMPE